jgi:hypothetical protein
MDLVPEVKIIVHREGEAVDDGSSTQAEPVQEQQAEAPAEVPAAATEATEA